MLILKVRAAGYKGETGGVWTLQAGESRDEEQIEDLGAQRGSGAAARETYNRISGLSRAASSASSTTSQRRATTTWESEWRREGRERSDGDPDATLFSSARRRENWADGRLRPFASSARWPRTRRGRGNRPLQIRRRRRVCWQVQNKA